MKKKKKKKKKKLQKKRTQKVVVPVLVMLPLLSQFVAHLLCLLMIVQRMTLIDDSCNIFIIFVHI